MFCIKCGKQNDEQSKFCIHCGRELLKGNIKDEINNSVEKITQSRDTKESKIVFASQNKRFVNYIIDCISFYVFSFVVGLLLGFSGLYYSLGIEDVNDGWFGIIIVFVFYVFFEAIWGKTPGKFITKTRVLMEDGKKPEFWDIAIRTVIRFVPFEAFSFFVKKENLQNLRGWHDKWSKTIVVNDIR